MLVFTTSPVRNERHGRFGALFTSGSKTMQEIADEVGVDQIVSDIREVVDPLVEKLLFYTRAVRDAKRVVSEQDQSNGLGQVDPATLAVAGQIAPAFGPIGGGIGLALNLTAGLISAGNAEKEAERFGKVKQQLEDKQPILVGQVERAIILLARAGDPESIAILESRLTGVSALKDIEKKGRRGSVFPIVAAAGAGLVALSVLRGGQPTPRPPRRGRIGAIPEDAFDIALQEILAMQEKQEVPIFERVFNTKAFLKQRSGTVRQFNTINDLIAKLGDANNRLMLALAIKPETDFKPLVSRVPEAEVVSDDQLEADFRAGKLILTLEQWNRISADASTDDIKNQVFFTKVDSLINVEINPQLNPDSPFFSKDRVLTLMRERSDFDRARAKIIALGITSLEGAERYARGTLFGFGMGGSMIRSNGVGFVPGGGDGGLSGRVDRFRVAGLGQESDQLQAMRATLQAKEGLILTLLDDMNRIAIDRRDVIEGREVVDTAAALWAQDIADWAGRAAVSIREPEFAQDVLNDQWKSMTKRLNIHVRIVLEAQIKAFQELGDEGHAIATQQALDLFRSRLAIGNQEGARRAGLGKIGIAPIVPILILTTLAAWLADGIVEAWGGSIQAAVNADVAELQLKTATIQNNTRRIDLTIIEGVVAGEEQGRSDIADKIRDIGKKIEPNTSFWAEASGFLGSVGKLALLGTAIFVGLRFILPAVTGAMKKKSA